MPKEHVVQQGETLFSIGSKYNVAWKTIFDADENKELKEKRKNPDILMPGDVVIIPDVEPKKKKSASGNAYQFKKYNKKNQPKVKIKFNGPEGAIKNTEYTLKYGETEVTGTTDGEGVFEEKIDPEVTEAILVLGETEYTLKINQLDPINEISGIQARLNNLGFPCGAVDNVDGPNTQKGVKQFQQAHQLDADGIAGPKTQKKLKEIYGS